MVRLADRRKPHAKAATHELDRLLDAWSSLQQDDPCFDDVEERYTDAVMASSLFPSEQDFIWIRGERNRAATLGPYSPYASGLQSADQVEPLHISGRVDFGFDIVREAQNIDTSTREHLAVLHGLLLADPDEGDLRQTHGMAALSPRVREQVLSDSPAARDWSELLTELYNPDTEAETRRKAQEWEATKKRVDVRIAGIAQNLAERTNDLLSQVLLDAPRADLRLAATELRFARQPAYWRFGRNQVDFEMLSRAESSWARRAISIAQHLQLREEFITPDLGRRTLVLLDEPEAALHRAAESNMARALRHLTSLPGFTIVVATHSPDLLDAAEAHVFEIKRNARLDGRSVVQELDLAARESLAGLGLNPSDLLRWPRVFLAVEGEHDEVLIDAWLGDRLRAARVKVLPLHGGKRLSSTVDSQVLFDHTDAHLVALLDNVRADQLTKVWEAAKAAAMQNDVSGAKRMIVTGLPDDQRSKGQEYSYIRPWLTKSLDKNVFERITPYGLEAADIVRYLPVELVVPGAGSWTALDDEHERAVAAAGPRQSPLKDFKQWLRQTHNVHFTPDLIRRVAKEVQPPREFERLAKTLEAASSQVGWTR